MRIAMVAGETSGDALGAGLLRELGRRVEGIEVRGIGGPRMAAQGAESLYPMDAISIMGLDGLLGSVREILAIRRDLRSRLAAWRPDVFVGIDVPDFNLSLELGLRRAGIPTVHYVSPTVWAWRRYRIRRIRRAVSRMLTLFPFEEVFYRDQGVPVTCVGHPLADSLERLTPDQARARLGLPREGRVVALLPGSRASEISRLGAVFAETARRLAGRYANLHFVVPCASQSVRPILVRELVERIPGDHVLVTDGGAQAALQAADVALLASGTAALEAALCRTPMVVAYRVSALSYLMVRAFSSVRHYSMPNHLLPEPVVPEYLQSRATADNLAPALRRYLDDDTGNRRMRELLAGVADGLARGADARAAEAVLAVAREAA